MTYKKEENGEPCFERAERAQALLFFKSDPGKERKAESTERRARVHLRLHLPKGAGGYRAIPPYAIRPSIRLWRTA